MAARTTRMQNANRFKLGLFGMNCSGSFATTAPERWQAGWPENLEAARLADEAGLEFILPIARWTGYGGQTDRQGTSFESLSWAAALLASTEEIVAFSTIHVPLVHPVFGALIDRFDWPVAFVITGQFLELDSSAPVRPV